MAKLGGIIALQVNGDPYGSGFVATYYKDRAEYATGIGVYQGDKGAQTRAFWRNWARRNDCVLIERED